MRWPWSAPVVQAPPGLAEDRERARAARADSAAEHAFLAARQQQIDEVTGEQAAVAADLVEELRRNHFASFLWGSYIKEGLGHGG